MNRAHALIVSFGVAVAIAGVFALTSPVFLRGQARASTDKQVATRAAQLDRYEASLRRARAQKPPKLPAIPAAGIQFAGAQSAAPAGVPSTPVRVVYHRPPPIVVVKHRAGSEGEAEYEPGSELDD